MRRTAIVVACALGAWGCTADDNVGGTGDDAGLDVTVPGVDASIDVASGGHDASSHDANADAEPDVVANPDTGIDTGTDTGLDAATDAPFDAGVDATEAGADAGADADADAAAGADADAAADAAADADAGAITMLGPTPYLSTADSPFASLGLSQFYLEDFEDHLLNTPGASSDVGGSVMGAGSLIDSVDGDDGTVDGKCAKSGDCDDWFYGNRAIGITYTFDASVLGALPTRAGIVWTDGGGQVTFQAYDANGNLLGQIGPISDANFPDNSIDGTVGEDRFFGVVFAGGIKSIHIANSSGGIESDHLQYGR